MEDSDYGPVVVDDPQGSSPMLSAASVEHDASSVADAPIAPSDAQILAFVEANIGNPSLIAETAAQYGVSVADLSRATGYDTTTVSNYLQQADVAPSAPSAAPVNSVDTNANVPVNNGTSKAPLATLIDKANSPVTNTSTGDVNKPVNVSPTLTDYQGHQYDGSVVLNLAQQLAQNAGSMSGGVFQTKRESIGFDVSEADKLLGRPATSSEQVLLDMARQMIQNDVTNLSQLQAKDITTTGNVFQLGNGKFYVDYALDPNDPESNRVREVTPKEAARIKTEQIFGDSENGPQIRQTIDGIITGKGLYAGDKLLSQSDASSNPLSYTIGNTYTGGGGTNYQLSFDPSTGKSLVTANGFSTSDANLIAPVLMIASNILMPGVGTLLTDALLEAGVSQFTSQVVSNAVISGISSGVMSVASGNTFGDGFLKGTITGGLTAGLTPVIQMALPSDLSPAVANTLAKAGTAVVTALATNQDPVKLLTTTLLNSAVSGGLSMASGELGLSTADARLLASTLTPIVSQLITTGKVDNNTLMNTVLMGGATILANIGSDAVNQTKTLTTGDDKDTKSETSGLTTMQNSENGTLKNLASTVGTGLSAVSLANNLMNVGKSLTNPTTNVNTTKANLVNALKTNTAKTTPTTKTAAATLTGLPTTKPAGLPTGLPTAKTAVATTKTSGATPIPAALSALIKTSTAKAPTVGPLNTIQKSMNADQVSQGKPSAPSTKVNVANLIPLKKLPPKKVDIKNLKPISKLAQLPVGLNMNKMG